jgi:hypothetical protein
LPRKYRPPVAKRRKSRKTPIPYEAAHVHDDSGDTLDAHEDGEAPLVAVDVAEPVPEPEDRPLRKVSRTEGERHISRDYSHVRGELLRIVAIASFIIIGLIVTAVLR